MAKPRSTSPETPVRGEQDFARYSVEEKLFGKLPPSRLQMLEFATPSADGLRQFTINIWRNHAIESITPMLERYAAFGRWAPDWKIGAYDYTLSFSGHHPAALELVWLDPRELLATLSASGFAGWLHERLLALRQLSPSPIVLATWNPDGALPALLSETLRTIPAVYLADLQVECDAQGVALIDARTERFAGTPLSAPAQLCLARKLAVNWLPGLLLPPLKAILVDLDETLYSGALVEDGIDALVLTPAHSRLQQVLLAQRAAGVFLGVVSRNEAADVEAMFNRRTDFPLTLGDFSVREISWANKAEAIARIATQLRIGLDAVVYVDDNAGELATVQQQHPRLFTVWAAPDADVTAAALEAAPGLWRWQRGHDDAVRVHDLEVSSEREKLAAAADDVDSYLTLLRPRIAVSVDAAELLPRLAELCIKTNQFNLALRRMTASELADLMQRANASVSSVALSDRLADSGTVALIAAERQRRRIVVHELCISCRALGRQLENSLVAAALRKMAIFDGCDEIVFNVSVGPRNEPARRWLASLLGNASNALADGAFALPLRALPQVAAGVAIIDHPHSI